MVDGGEDVVACVDLIGVVLKLGDVITFLGSC
jgi:hypothetical protein